jgi:hypothetical protein
MVATFGARLALKDLTSSLYFIDHCSRRVNPENWWLLAFQDPQMLFEFLYLSKELFERSLACGSQSAYSL